MPHPAPSVVPAAPTERTGAGKALALAALAILAGCTPSPPITPESFELANIDPDNIVPKSSPAALVRAFSDFCVDQIGNLGALPDLLRSRDYVAVPELRPNGLYLYVVDDKRPMVMLSEGAQSSTCAVAAESRTGQTNRVLSFVATEFPEARPIDPARIGPSAEAAWFIGETTTIIFILREGTQSAPAQIVVGLTRTWDEGTQP